MRKGFLILIVLGINGPGVAAVDKKVPIVYSHAEVIIAPPPVPQVLQASSSGTPAPAEEVRKPQTIAVEAVQGEKLFDAAMIVQTVFKEGEGLLFILQQPDHAILDLSVLYVSRDIVFIRQDGVITEIIPETKPQSLDPVISTYPVLWVLQLNAGEAKKRGIRIGDVATVKMPT